MKPSFAAGILLAVLLPALAPAQSPRTHFRQGMNAFESGEFAASAEAFAQAAEAAEGTRLDPAVAAYNRGKALAALGESDEAAELFTRALRTTDLDLQQRAYHNRGNTLVSQADALVQSQDLPGAMSVLQEAQTMFAQAITLDPGDKSPKVNYELTARRIEELREQQQEQQEQQQQDQDQESSEDQQQQDQENQQEQQDQQQDSQDQQQQDQQQQDQQQQDQQQQDQQQQEPQQQPDQGEEPEDGEPQSGEPRPSEEMTAEEAKMMLDAIREEEEAERRKVRVQYGQPRQVEKDW